MSDERFGWNRVDNITGAFELKRRDIKRTLIKDSDLRCWAKDCGKRCRRSELVYWPSEGTSKNNKVIGHVSCIDRIVEIHTAKSTAEAAAIATKGLIPNVPVVAKAVGRKTPGNGNGNGNVAGRIGDPLLQLEGLRKKIWQEGYEAGIAAAVAKLTGSEDKQQEFRH